MAIFLILTLNLLVFSGLTAARILFSLYSLQLGASPADVGGVMAVMYVFPLLISWPIGVLADRYPARWLLAGGTAAGAAGMLAPAVFPVVASLYVASLLFGITLAFTHVMGQSLIGSISKPEERTRNFSNYSLTGSVANFTGPLAAGFTIDHFGYRVTCAGIAVVLLAAVALLLFRGKVLPRSEPKAGSGGNLLRTLADRRLWGMLTISSLAQLGSDIFLIFLPIHAHGVGHSASTIGILMAVFSAGSFAVRLTMVRLISRLGESRLLTRAFLGAALVFVLLPFASGAVVLALLAFLFGLCQGCAQPLTMMLMFNSAEPGRAGEAIGLRMTVNNACRLVGPVMFGGVAAITGLAAVFWINGLLMATGGRMSAPRKADGAPEA